MKFTITHSYPKDTETVFSVLCNPEYLKKKFEYTGARNIEIIECREKDGLFVIKNSREIPSTPPGFAKKFVKPWNRVVGTDTWHNFMSPEKHGTFVVDIQGVPVNFSGSLELVPTDSGCDYVINFNVTVKIPLIGSKLEKLAQQDTSENQKLDYEFTLRYLEAL